MKKIIKIILVIFIIAILITGAYIVYDKFIIGESDDNTDDLTSAQLTAKVMRETKPTDVFFLGSKVEFENFTPIYIDKITDENLKSSKEYKVIIIYDLDDLVELDDDEIALLKEMINEHGVLLLYFGTKYATTWDTDGYGVTNSDGNLSYEYYSVNNEPSRGIGWWTEQDQKYAQEEENSSLFEDSVLGAIEDYFEELDR